MLQFLQNIGTLKMAGKQKKNLNKFKNETKNGLLID